MEQKEQKNTGKHMRGFRISENSEESKRGLDSCSVLGDINLPEQKQQQESISAGEGSNLNWVDPQLSRTVLGNVLVKNRRFSADGQNIAQNCTTMTVVVTTQYWTAVSPQKKICSQSSLRKLRLQ